MFKINIYQNSEKISARAHVEILDRQDGSFIVRYRLYDSYENLYISIKNRLNEHISQSPYFLNGVLNHDNCDCPDTDLEEWFKFMNCNETYPRIDRDIQTFSNAPLDMSLAGKLIINKYNQRYSQSLCNYLILKNKV